MIMISHIPGLVLSWGSAMISVTRLSENDRWGARIKITSSFWQIKDNVNIEKLPEKSRILGK